MKKRILYISLLVMLVVFGGCSNNNNSKKTETATKTEQTSKKELKKMKIGYNPATGNILGFIAIEKGFDKEYGIEMELVPFSNTTDALTALQAGKIDVGASFGTAAPLTHISNGTDFTIFSGYLSGGMPIFANADFEYKGLESFVGKKVATARMYTPDIVWRVAMKDAGYDLEKDVEIMEFKKPTEALEALKSGNVDITIGTNSTYLQAGEAGLKVIAWSNEMWDPVHVCCRPVGLTENINNNKESFKGFIKAYIRAQEVLETEQDYAVKVNAKYLELDEETARIMLLDTNQDVHTDPKSDGIQFMWEKLQEIDYIDAGDIDVTKHINIELYKEAIDELSEEFPDSDFYKNLYNYYEENNQRMLKEG